MEMEWLRGKFIGKGAFGTVHVAVDRATGRAFAVKSVDVKNSPAAAVACLESEIRILKLLSSPYVVAYLGDDTTAASRNLHMELVPGGSVGEAAARSGGIGELAARGVLRRVAAALHYLHAVPGVVHGDVKGRNVLAGSDYDGGGAKLADFGAARLITDAAPGGPRGTPAWMAPEVARGCAPTPASDVWSLGCTAVELLTGRRPWSELGCPGEVGELLLLIGFGGKRPELPAWVSDSCLDFLDKCLRRDASDRWTSECLLSHPFLALEPHSAGEALTAALAPSPRTVLDWPASDSESEAIDDPEPNIEHEVITRAKGRVAELASNCPGIGPDWESDPTWATDMWTIMPSKEIPEPASSSNSAAAADTENNNSGGPTVSHYAVDGAAAHGFDGYFICYSHWGCCNSELGVSWPPLAVATAASCIILLIQSKLVFKPCHQLFGVFRDVLSVTCPFRRFWTGATKFVKAAWSAPFKLACSFPCVLYINVLVHARCKEEQ